MQAPDPSGLVRRFERLVATLGAAEPRSEADTWCRALSHVLGVDAAALSLQVAGELGAPLGASDRAAATGEQVHFTVRESPCLTACDSERPVVVADVRDPASAAWARWPAWSAQLVRHTDFRAVSALPVRVGTGPVGSLNLYSRTPRPRGHVEEALALAGHIGAQLSRDLLLGGATAAPAADRLARLAAGSGRRRQVWVAQGMTAAANGLGLAEALALLRARAFATDTLLDDLADDILHGRAPVPTLCPGP